MLISVVFSFPDALMEYTNGEFTVTGANATANIFASYPSKHLSILNGFVDQVGVQTNLQLIKMWIWKEKKKVLLLFCSELMLSIKFPIRILCKWKPLERTEMHVSVQSVQSWMTVIMHVRVVCWCMKNSASMARIDGYHLLWMCTRRDANPSLCICERKR